MTYDHRHERIKTSIAGLKNRIAAVKGYENTVARLTKERESLLNNKYAKAANKASNFSRLNAAKANVRKSIAELSNKLSFIAQTKVASQYVFTSGEQAAVEAAELALKNFQDKYK